jgi:HEAT repeat protein
VRLRAAQGLLAGKDNAGIPTLISLLTEAASVFQSWQAEELLHYVAGADAPDVIIGSGTIETRKQSRAEWAAWWRQKGKNVDLVALDQKPNRPGLILVSEISSVNRKGVSRIGICGCDEKPRWFIEMLSDRPFWPVQLVSDDRFLMVNNEDSAKPPSRERIQLSFSIVERDLLGRIVKVYKTFKAPQSHLGTCQRLPNGNLFLAYGHGVSELNAEGKVIYSYNQAWPPRRPEYSLRSTRKLNNGRIIVNLKSEQKGNQEQVTRELDPATGTVIRSYPYEGETFLPNGHRLHTQPSTEDLLKFKSLRIAEEFDSEGELLRQWGKFPDGTAAITPLRNGNILVSRACSHWKDVLESDSDGRVVWQTMLERNSQVNGICLGLVRLCFDQPRPPDINLRTSVYHNLKGLKSKDVTTRQRSVSRLVLASGPQAEVAITAMIEAMADPEYRVASQARTSLGFMGPVAVPHLAKALKHPNPRVRTFAASFCRDPYPETRAALPQLLEALKDPEIEVRCNVVYSLADLAKDFPEAIPMIIGGLQDEDSKVRVTATIKLGHLGSLAKSAIPSLLKMVKDEDWKIRSRSIETLQEIGYRDKLFITLLINALKDNDNRVRKSAALVLGIIGPDAKDALPALLEVMEEVGEVGVEARKAREKILRN